MKQLIRYGALVLAAWIFVSPALAADDDWVARSNEYANLLLADIAKYSPEGAGGLGVDGLDEEVRDLGEGVFERGMESTGEMLTMLQASLETETDPKVRQDLGILIKVQCLTCHGVHYVDSNTLTVDGP